jgi:hypothetical protein
VALLMPCLRHSSATGVGEGYYFRRDTGFQSSLASHEKQEFVYYREGTLLIDIIDSTTDKLIWRGTANKRIPKEKGLSQEKRQKLIKRAVNASAVLADFPPSDDNLPTN